MANKSCIDRSAARRSRHVTRVIWTPNVLLLSQRQRGPSSHLRLLAVQVEEAICAADLHFLSKCCTGTGSTDIFLPVCPPEWDALL